MTCPTTITPAPIPGINDMRAVTAHGLADAATLLREYAAMLDGRSLDDDQAETHTRALAAVQRAAKLLTERDEVLVDAVQSARLQADMIDRLTAERDAARAELAQARKVLRGPEWMPADIHSESDSYYDRCPVCWSERHKGHRPDCTLSAALAAKE